MVGGANGTCAGAVLAAVRVRMERGRDVVLTGADAMFGYRAVVQRRYQYRQAGVGSE
jgi:hypothetical protein